MAIICRYGRDGETRMLGNLSLQRIRGCAVWISTIWLLVFVYPRTERAQTQNTAFNSGSTGHEGTLNITAPGVTYFDPVAMNLNPSVPGIFNFTTINVASGSTLKFTESKYHGPVYFLASGDVTISGILDLKGDNAVGINFSSQ